MIQEASEDVTEGGILFPSFKTSYIGENIKTDEGKRQFITGFALKRLGALQKRLAHDKSGWYKTLNP